MNSVQISPLCYIINIIDLFKISKLLFCFSSCRSIGDSYNNITYDCFHLKYLSPPYMLHAKPLTLIFHYIFTHFSNLYHNGKHSVHFEKPMLPLLSGDGRALGSVVAEGSRSAVESGLGKEIGWSRSLLSH